MDLTEDQKNELAALEITSKQDPSTRLLYCAKKGNWDGVRGLLHAAFKYDYSMTDQVKMIPMRS